MSETIWADPRRADRYITNLRSNVMNEEYRRRCLAENGRADSPLTETQRMRFDLDMLDKYAEHFPLPDGLYWRVYTLRIQLQAKGNTPAISAANARRGAEQ